MCETINLAPSFWLSNSTTCTSPQLSPFLGSLTFIRTHRKSHTKELWGLLGPQVLVLYPCKRFEKKMTISSLWGPKRPQEFLLRLIEVFFKIGTKIDQKDETHCHVVVLSGQS